ncbi:hypothetical protein DK872_26245 [Kosakonia sp. MH5]|nr:hypothetical protein [Kosakonia sp. MH5]
MRVLVIAGAIVTGCGLREIYHGHQDGMILAGVLLGPAVLIFALSEMFSCETWSSFCEGQLESYEPADAGAFHALQAVVISSGKLEKEALGQWIELEREALAATYPASMVSESKDTCEGQS